MDEPQEVGTEFEFPFGTIAQAEAENRLVDAEAETALRRIVDYAVVDPETGIVQHCGAAQFRDLAGMAGEGRVVLEIKVDNPAKQTVVFTAKGASVADVAPPVVVTADAVLLACRRRILAAYDVFDQLNAQSDGFYGEMRQWIDAMRVQCAKLIAMEPAPQDYDTDKHWPEAPASARKQEPDE